MAQKIQTRDSKSTTDETPDPELVAHIRSLGLQGVDDYRAWCDRHGFSRRTQKHWRQRLKERAFATRAAADARLARKKSELRRPERVIERIFRGEVPEDVVTQPYLGAVCRAYEAAKQCRHTRRALLRLLLHVCRYGDLLSLEPVIAEYGCQEGNSLVEGVIALGRRWAGWQRPVEDWRPRTHNSLRQFSSLARHLFACWPVPAFMDSVWFRGNSQEAVRRQGWFLHVGRGENIRTADLPLPYTKRMAQHFMQAPSDLSVESALRWGQIHAMGGNERLVRGVVATRLGTDFEHEEFWATVLLWLVAHPMLDTARIGPIVDYIHHQKFVSQTVFQPPYRVFTAPGVIERQGPPQPNFEMKGRTPESLLRQVDAWHRQLARVEQPAAEWARSGIGSFEFVEGSEQSGNLRIWTVRELVSTKSLFAEGRTMKHCVATYARSCAHGQCSIWTMELETFEGKRKVLTIEVNNAARLICQARGKCNALPGEKHRGLLQRWAQQSGLRVASFV